MVQIPNAIAPITCLGHNINIDIHNKNFNEKVSKMIFFNINLVLQSELSPEKRKRPSRPPRMRSGWLFDEVDVTVNTEERGT